VIGKNDGWKQNINLGRRNNQNFVNIPFSKFIQMIGYKAQEIEIEVILTEESYTSKCDHLAGEEMEHQEKYLGRRIKRGRFKSSIGKILNADINGAIGILRKKKEISDAQLLGLRNRGDVVSPKKLFKVS
jgi:putative transposase